MSDFDDEEIEESCSESETDSDDEYNISIDDLRALSTNNISELVLQAVYKKQCGMCRISKIPFTNDNGPYSAVAVPRVFYREFDDTNVILVCKALHTMRESLDMPWRKFTRLIQLLKECEL